MKAVWILLLSFPMASGVSAMVVASGDRVVIDHTVYEDIYISAGTVLIEAPVHGSLIVAGGTVVVKDSVMNDILMGGGELLFDGYVGGTVRCAGGRLTVNAGVAHDLVAAGGTLVIGRKGSIGGDVLAGGGSLQLDGIVRGNASVRAGSYVQDGVVRGDLDCRAKTIDIGGSVGGKSRLAATEDLTIGNHATLADEVRWWTPDHRLSGAWNKGQAIYDPSLEIDRGRWYFFGARGVAGLLAYTGMALVMMLVLQYLFPSAFAVAGRTVAERPVRSLFYGVLFVVTVPVAAVVCFISVVGVPLGLIFLAGYITVMLLGGVITALVAACWLRDRTGGKWRSIHLVLVALGMWIVLRIIFATPLLGVFLFCVLVCMAFGALLTNVRWKRKKEVVR